MQIEEIKGYHEFINKSPQTSRIFLNEYFKIIQDNLDHPHSKDKSRPGAYDWHHIIPESMGGETSPKVLLEFKDHVLAHYYLFKAFRNEEMAYAFNLLSNRTSASDFENFTEDEKDELLESLQSAREIFGERRSQMAKEYWAGDAHPTRGKFGEDHHGFGKIIINDRDSFIRVTLEEFENTYKSLGWNIGMPVSTKQKMKDKKSGYIKIHSHDEEKTIPESDLDIFLSTGWELGRHPGNSSHLIGKCRYATPDGQFYGMLSHDDLIIQELGLITHVTDKVIESALKANKLASDVNRGSTVYNNGIIQKRCKEHPGEGWIAGELPVSEELKKKRGDACSDACKDTIVYNDGIRNYRVKPDESPEPHWTKGMAPQKKRGPTKQKGWLTYNDGIKNFKIPPDQIPDPSWTRGMKPRPTK